MRVRITQRTGYGARDGRVFGLGDVADLDDALAVKLITNRIAEPAPAPVVRTAEAAPEANTAKRVGKPAPRKPRAGSRKGTFSAPKE